MTMRCRRPASHAAERGRSFCVVAPAQLPRHDVLDREDVRGVVYQPHTLVHQVSHGAVLPRQDRAYRQNAEAQQMGHMPRVRFVSRVLEHFFAWPGAVPSFQEWRRRQGCRVPTRKIGLAQDRCCVGIGVGPDAFRIDIASY
jgi:hypothetical protein